MIIPPERANALPTYATSRDLNTFSGTGYPQRFLASYFVFCLPAPAYQVSHCPLQGQEMRKVQIYPHQLEAGSNLNVSFMRIQTFFVHLVMQGDCPFLCEGGWSLNFAEALAICSLVRKNREFYQAIHMVTLFSSSF
jgi:hypothetical protein